MNGYNSLFFNWPCLRSCQGSSPRCTNPRVCYRPVQQIPLACALHSHRTLAGRVSHNIMFFKEVYTPLKRRLRVWHVLFCIVQYGFAFHKKIFLPALVNVGTGRREVWAVFFVRTPRSSCLSAHLKQFTLLLVVLASDCQVNLSRWPILTPAPADEGHPDVVGVDSRNRVASPSWSLWHHWTHCVIDKQASYGMESPVVPHLEKSKL